MLIRAFFPEDVVEVKRLIDRTIDVSYRGAYSAQAIAFFKDYHSLDNISGDARNGRSLVASVDGRVVGTATLLGDEIKRVFVAPEEQGRGIGGALMRALLDKARSEGLRSVSLDASVVSRSVYEHLGFRSVREGRHELGEGQTLDYTVMALDL